MNSNDLKVAVDKYVDKNGGLKASASVLTEVLEHCPGRSIQEKCYLIHHEMGEIPLTVALQPLRFLSFRQGYIHRLDVRDADMKSILIELLFKDGLFNDRGWRSIPKNYADWICNNTVKSNPIEGLYWIYHGLSDWPKHCKHCHSPVTKFVSFNVGYQADYCSSVCANNATDTLNKKKETTLKKYGVEHFQQAQEVKDKISESVARKRNDLVERIRADVSAQGFTIVASPNNTISNNQFVLRCDDGHEFHRNLAGWNRWVVTCPECSKTRSSYEKDIVRRIREFYNGEIQYSVRTVIAPLEIDIWIPEFKLGIELNGDYWHSRNNMNEDANRHLRKTEMAESVGVDLIHVSEREWLNQSDIVIDKIKTKMKLNSRIPARKCQIVELSYQDASEFLKKNHIQGSTRTCPIRIGLMYDDELIAVGTFGKPRFNSKIEYELLRFSVKRGVSVVGGFSKILNSFKKLYNPKSLISYADRRYSSGNVYRQSGFDELKPSQPNYVYIKGAEIRTRYQCQKHMLESFLEHFDPNESEAQNMFNNGWRQLHDCGNRVFVMYFA